MMDSMRVSLINHSFSEMTPMRMARCLICITDSSPTQHKIDKLGSDLAI